MMQIIQNNNCLTQFNFLFFPLLFHATSATSLNRTSKHYLTILFLILHTDRSVRLSNPEIFLVN